MLVRHVLWALPDPEAAIGRWVTLLRPGGRVVIGHLNDENLWGGPVPDERYLALSTA